MDNKWVISVITLYKSWGYAVLGALACLLLGGALLHVQAPKDTFSCKAGSSWISYLPEYQEEGVRDSLTTENYDLFDDSFIYLPNVYNASVRTQDFEGSLFIYSTLFKGASMIDAQTAIAEARRLFTQLEDSIASPINSNPLQNTFGIDDWSELGRICPEKDSRPYPGSTLAWVPFAATEKSSCNSLIIEGIVVAQPSCWLQAARPGGAQLPLFLRTGGLDDQSTQSLRQKLETLPQYPCAPESYYKIDIMP